MGIIMTDQKFIKIFQINEKHYSKPGAASEELQRNISKWISVLNPIIHSISTTSCSTPSSNSVIFTTQITVLFSLDFENITSEGENLFLEDYPNYREIIMK